MIGNCEVDWCLALGNKSSGSEVEPKPVEEEETVVDDSEKSSKFSPKKSKGAAWETPD